MTAQPGKMYKRCIGPWPKCGHLAHDECTAGPEYQAPAGEELTGPFTFHFSLDAAQVRYLRRFRNTLHTMFQGSTLNGLSEPEFTQFLDNIINQTVAQAPKGPSGFAPREKPTPVPPRRLHDPHPPNCGCMYCMNG